MNANKDRFRAVLDAKHARNKDQAVEEIVPNEMERPAHWHRARGRRTTTGRTKA